MVRSTTTSDLVSAILRPVHRALPAVARRMGVELQETPVDGDVEQIEATSTAATTTSEADRISPEVGSRGGSGMIGTIPNMTARNVLDDRDHVEVGSRGGSGMIGTIPNMTARNVLDGHDHVEAGSVGGSGMIETIPNMTARNVLDGHDHVEAGSVGGSGMIGTIPNMTARNVFDDRDHVEAGSVGGSGMIGSASNHGRPFVMRVSGREPIAPHEEIAEEAVIVERPVFRVARRVDSISHLTPQTPFPTSTALPLHGQGGFPMPEGGLGGEEHRGGREGGFPRAEGAFPLLHAGLHSNPEVERGLGGEERSATESRTLAAKEEITRGKKSVPGRAFSEDDVSAPWDQVPPTLDQVPTTWDQVPTTWDQVPPTLEQVPATLEHLGASTLRPSRQLRFIPVPEVTRIPSAKPDSPEIAHQSPPVAQTSPQISTSLPFAENLTRAVAPIFQEAHRITHDALTVERSDISAIAPAAQNAVSNTFNVNVHVGSDEPTGLSERESLEQALCDVLRDVARRHGLEV